MKSRIAVISVLYKNPKEQVERLEKSLLANGIAKKDIFFVDNEIKNIGYGMAINKVVRRQMKNYDYFFIVNPDVTLHKDCLKRLLQTLEENPKIGIVGPKILDEKGKIWAMGGVINKKRYSGYLLDNGKKDKNYIKNFYEVDFLPGTAMLVKKEVFQKAGFFDNKYFLYYEDDDFSFQTKKAGFRLVVNPYAVIIHYESTSTGKGSPLQRYYLTRNNMLFVERYAPLWVKIREVIRLPKTIYEIRNDKYDLIGLRDYLLRRFGKRDYWS